MEDGMFQSESKLWHNSYGPAQLMFPVIQLLSCLPTVPAPVCSNPFLFPHHRHIPDSDHRLGSGHTSWAELLRWQEAWCYQLLSGWWIQPELAATILNLNYHWTRGEERALRFILLWPRSVISAHTVYQPGRHGLPNLKLPVIQLWSHCERGQEMFAKHY